MFTYSQVGRSCSVSIVPSTGSNAGKPVGTGYGYTVSTAEYFACVDEMAVRKLAKMECVPCRK
jgi:hypothetical protein